MKKLFRKKSGESLVEVIVAIFVVSIGSSVATTLIVSALQANTFSRDSLIALNLATEGLEAMRNIRDSNWLRFSYDKANCWNISPTATDCTLNQNGVGNNNPMLPGFYTIDLQPNNFTYHLTQVMSGFPLDLTHPIANSAPYQLSAVDLDAARDTDNDLNPSNDHDFFASNVVNDPSSHYLDLGLTPFYRMIEISYPNGPANDPTDQSLTVTSTVQWQAQGVPHSVVLQTILSNYQKTQGT